MIETIKTDEYTDTMNKAEFFVEANSNEVLNLWSEYKDKLHWQQGRAGFWQKIGTVGGDENKPVCVSFNFDTLNGKLICFYDATSRFVDTKMIEDYIKSFNKKYDNGTRWALIDAMNFHHVYHYVMEGYQIPTDTTETNESWVRNQLSPVVNVFAMMDAGIHDHLGMKELFNQECYKALEAMEAIVKRIPPFKDI